MDPIATSAFASTGARALASATDVMFPAAAESERKALYRAEELRLKAIENENDRALRLTEVKLLAADLDIVRKGRDSFIRKEAELKDVMAMRGDFGM